MNYRLDRSGHPEKNSLNDTGFMALLASLTEIFVSVLGDILSYELFGVVSGLKVLDFVKYVIP